MIYLWLLWISLRLSTIFFIYQHIFSWYGSLLDSRNWSVWEYGHYSPCNLWPPSSRNFFFWVICLVIVPDCVKCHLFYGMVTPGTSEPVLIAFHFPFNFFACPVPELFWGECMCSYSIFFFKKKKIIIRYRRYVECIRDCSILIFWAR